MPRQALKKTKDIMHADGRKQVVRARRKEDRRPKRLRRATGPGTYAAETDALRLAEQGDIVGAKKLLRAHAAIKGVRLSRGAKTFLTFG